MLSRILGLLFWTLVSLSAGMFGRIFQPGEWYQALNKPAWTPPGWIFPPVWTALYLMMGIAAWLIWRNRSAASKSALIIFVIQLLLNAAWSWIFFGRHGIGGGLIEIGFLWCAIVLTIVKFSKIDRSASLLLLPYLIWVSFASALNAAIFILN